MEITTVVRETIQEEDRKYPYIGAYEGDDSGLIVLFTDVDTGTALNETGHNTIGEYSEFWDEEEFRVFNGSVTLSV